MPQENRAHADVLAAIAKTAALAELSGQGPGRGLPEAELQALLEGHERAGQKVAPYLRLLTYEPSEEIVREGAWGGDRFFFVVEGQAEVFVKRGYAKVGELLPGALFGEMSVLANLPRSSTVSAPQNSAVTVLEVQRPAVPLLRKLPQFAAVLDKAYRRNSRALFLQDVGVATRLDAEALGKLATISQFRVYETGHTLFQEGEPMRRLFILKSGWLKLRKAGEAAPAEMDEHDWAAPAGAEYLGAGYCFGLEGVESELPWPQTGTLLARAEVLEISLSLLRELPVLLEDIGAALKKLAPAAAQAYQRQPLPIAAAQHALIRTGVADSANLLAIDARTCIRCGNCVQACHDLHGQPRLSRRGFTLTRPVALTPGATLQPLIVPSVCQHCRQPDCLPGCPVNAIKQLPDGRVELDAAACIGCGDCVALCPFDAITLTPRTAEQTGRRGDGETQGEKSEARVAVKCDLCVGAACNASAQQPHVYGCEENCPTGALRRVVPDAEFTELSGIESARLKRAQKKLDATQPFARQRAPKPVRRLHLLGGAGALVILSLALMWPMYGVPANRGLAWLSGVLGALALLCAGAYAWRKRARTRRLGALRLWLLAHNYAGLWALLLFAWHCSSGLRSPLTKLLAAALGLAALTGVLGQVLNVALPRWLTKRETQPWLLEDLLARRAALRAEPSADAAQLRRLNQLIAGQRWLRHWVWPHVFSVAAALALLLAHLWQVIYFHWR